MSRPDEIVEWAEGAGAQVSEPANERAGGFPFRYVPPAEQINWMWRAVGRWIGWLRDKSDNHVHDGGPDDLSVAKIDFTNHIDYGTWGKLSVETDTQEDHLIRHIRQNGGQRTTFRTDRIHTGDAIIDKIIPVMTGGLPILRIVRPDPGDDPVILVVEGAVRTGELSSENVLVKKPFAPGHGEITANNTAKAWGVIKRSDAPEPSEECLIDGVGISSIRRVPNPTLQFGWWNVHLTSPVDDTDKAAVFITTRSNAFVTYRWIDDDHLEVQTYDPESPSSLKDATFSIQIFYANH